MVAPGKKKYSGHLLILYVFCFLLVIGLTSLLVDVFEKKEEGKRYQNASTELSDDAPIPEKWGKDFPFQQSSFDAMALGNLRTAYGGGEPYSKLIDTPQLTKLWAGYPFSADFNEERSHYFSQIDQAATLRNNTNWLKEHGFPNFKGQPGACMNCHSGFTPYLIRKLGWQSFNKTPYWDLKEQLKSLEGTFPHAADLGSTCADCHSPQNMALRVTRPAYVNAMVLRGYSKDEQQGVQAKHQEMRSHVCQQCHVEYYFKPETMELTFPWKNWPKGEPFRIEMLDQYYDAQAKEEKGFKKDWEHKDTGAPMIKIQHPEAEGFSSGLHARSGVSCADCHMPYQRQGANKVTSHNIRSPFQDIASSCGVCHRTSEQDLTKRILHVQNNTAQSLREAEFSILALIDDVKLAREALQKLPDFANIADEQDRKTKISAYLMPALEMHRKASMRWDFVSSENSTGFHFPDEAQRVLGQAKDFARRGQLELAALMSAKGVTIAITSGSGIVPPAPTPLPKSDMVR